MPATITPAPDAASEPPYWDCVAVATHLGISRRTVLRAAERGDLPGYLVPGMKRRFWRFRREDIEAAMRQQRSDAA